MLVEHQDTKDDRHDRQQVGDCRRDRRSFAGDDLVVQHVGGAGSDQAEDGDAGHHRDIKPRALDAGHPQRDSQPTQDRLPQADPARPS